MAWNDTFIQIPGNNPHNTFQTIPEGWFMNYTVMAWWYQPLQLVSRQVKHISNQQNYYNHQIMAWNDTFIEIPGNTPHNTFKTIPEGWFMN